jgi:hypothetical protein
MRKRTRKKIPEKVNEVRCYRMEPGALKDFYQSALFFWHGAWGMELDNFGLRIADFGFDEDKLTAAIGD